MEMVLAVIKKTINFEGHQNCITGSRVTRFCGIGECCLLAKFHPKVCACRLVSNEMEEMLWAQV